MRKTLTLIFTLITLSLFSQIYNPVSWEFSQSKISDSEIELHFKANIEDMDEDEAATNLGKRFKEAPWGIFKGAVTLIFTLWQLHN